MLFTPHSVGRFRLRHRIVTPPMTRAGHDEVATALMSQYYRRRASAAHNALAAGFDGVELHAGNGNLFEQFLDPGSSDGGLHADTRVAEAP